MIQTGGYKVRDTQSFGFNMTDLFSGSNYTIGLLFEVVVNCFKHKHNKKGHFYEMKFNSHSDIAKIARNFKEYVDAKDEKQQSTVDALIISNLNSTGSNLFTLSSFDFNLNSQKDIKDVQTYITKNVKSLQKQSTESAELDLNFVQKFAFSSVANKGVDQEIVLTVSLGNGILYLEEYKEMFEALPF